MTTGIGVEPFVSDATQHEDVNQSDDGVDRIDTNQYEGFQESIAERVFFCTALDRRSGGRRSMKC